MGANGRYKMAHKVLIVEDEHADLFKMMLEFDDEYQVDVALTGDQGVKDAKELNPDAIIMDLRLPNPGLNGIEAIQAIREFNPDVPIFAITAYNTRDTRQLAERAGANAYMAKPVDFMILFDHLEKSLNGHI